MITRLAPKTALATLAAVGLFLPFGASLPGACLRMAGAAPSPSCSGDLRECLRRSADMHQTTFGGRYVTADEVARCMEAFRACSSGGANSGGSASSPKGRSSDDMKGLPERFRMKDQVGVSSDCRVAGNKLECTLSWPTAPDYVDSWTGAVTGTVNGLTATGTATYRIESHSPSDTSCTGVEDYSGPISYVFRPDGTLTAKAGPNRRQTTTYCNGREGSNSGMTEQGEATGTWSAVK